MTNSRACPSETVGRPSLLPARWQWLITGVSPRERMGRVPQIALPNWWILPQGLVAFTYIVQFQLLQLPPSLEAE